MKDEKITHTQVAEPEKKEEQKKVTPKQYEIQSLRYDFTAIEIHEIGMGLSKQIQKKASIAEEKKTVVSQYSAKEKEAEATINKLAGQFKDGYEMRDVKCEVVFNIPENGFKTYIREDTGQSFKEKMTQFDHNLFNQAQDKAADVGESDWLNDEKNKLRGGAEGFVKGRQATDILNKVETGEDKPSKSTASNTKKGRKKKVAQTAKAPSGEIDMVPDEETLEDEFPFNETNDLDIF